MSDAISINDVYEIIDGKSLGYEEEIQSLDQDENRAAIEELNIRVDTLETVKEWIEFNFDSGVYDYKGGTKPYV